ncbi:hypothetical protein FBQ96_16415 [Nitrospirales bacterium NOB]|nr:hypothetical protein [Nitrospirales bacterium NOB]
MKPLAMKHPTFPVPAQPPIPFSYGRALIPLNIPLVVVEGVQNLSVHFGIWQQLQFALNRFAHAGIDDADGLRRSGRGDLPSTLFCGHETQRTLSSLERLQTTANDAQVRKRARDWTRKITDCMAIPRWVYPGDLLQNPVGYQKCDLDSCPVCSDGKRRLWRCRYQHVIYYAQKDDLEILFVSPHVDPAFFPSLYDAYRFNAKVWAEFSDASGFWVSAVKDWCRGRHVDPAWRRGLSVWSVHDHVVLILKKVRSKAMSSRCRIEERIRSKWKAAVRRAAKFFGIPAVQGSVHIEWIGKNPEEATKLAKYLTRAPLQPPRRKAERLWASPDVRRSKFRCFADLPTKLAEEFLLATRRHQWNFMSMNAKRRTAHFSSKERIPDPKLRTPAKPVKWGAFHRSVQRCANGQASPTERQQAMEALPHVIASLLVHGLHRIAKPLIRYWGEALDRRA